MLVYRRPERVIFLEQRALIMRFSSILTVVLLSVAGTVRAQESSPAADQGGNTAQKKTIEFDGNTLELAWQNRDQRGDTIQEFVPAGQTLDSWTKLAAYYEYPGIDEAKELVSAIVKKLNERTPRGPAAILENEETGELILDFVVWPEDNSYVEFNIFKYSKRPEGGLVAQQYALRAYGNDAEEFLKALRPIRERTIEEMATRGLTQGE